VGFVWGIVGQLWGNCGANMLISLQLWGLWGKRVVNPYGKIKNKKVKGKNKKSKILPEKVGKTPQTPQLQ